MISSIIELDLKLLFEAVDQFLEYPGQVNRRRDLMNVMIHVAKEQGWKLNVWDKHEAIPEEYRTFILEQMGLKK